MMSLSGEQFFVAELKVPSYFHISDVKGVVKRVLLPNPKGFEVNRGYWVVLPSDEQPDADARADLVIVIEFVHTTLKEAEDHALKVGRTFGSMASSYAGYPLGSPQLHRIASADHNGCLVSQHHYWYGHKAFMLSMFDETVGYQFQDYLERVSSIGGKTRYQVQSAIHWYGISISTDDPTVSFVAAWTGLESIGKVVDSIHHPDGPKAACQVCRNETGKDRDRKIAGIEHVARYVRKESLPESFSEEAKDMMASELVAGFSVKEARALRRDVVHGLQEVEVLVEKCTRLRRHLIHILDVSILVAIGPSTSSQMTGHHEIHPDGRFSFKINKKLRKLPYYGEWVEGFRYQTQSSVYSKDRPYVATVGFEWLQSEGVANLIEYMSEEPFRRDTDVFGLDGSVVLGLTTWHDRHPEPAWKEIPASYWDQYRVSPTSPDIDSRPPPE